MLNMTVTDNWTITSNPNFGDHMEDGDQDGMHNSDLHRGDRKWDMNGNNGDYIRQMRQKIFENKVDSYFRNADQNGDDWLDLIEINRMLQKVSDMDSDKDHGSYSFNIYEGIEVPVSFKIFRKLVGDVSGFSRLDK